MLQKTFGIYGEGLDGSALFIEVGRKHVACFCRSETSPVITAMEFFQFAEYDAGGFETLLYEIKNNSRLFTEAGKKVSVVWNTGESVCIPGAFATERGRSDFFNLVYGEKENTIVSGEETNGLMVASRVDELLQHTVENYFPGAQYVHQHYFLVNELMLNASSEPSMQLVFYPDYFTVAVCKDAQLQIIQTREYQVPEDVLYFILNICKQHDLPVADIDITASGFIVANSALYSLLVQYLQRFSLANTQRENFAAEGFDEQPLHFFRHFLNYVRI